MPQQMLSHYVVCKPCRETWGEVWMERTANRQANVNQPRYDTKRFDAMPKVCPNCQQPLSRKEP